LSAKGHVKLEFSFLIMLTQVNLVPFLVFVEQLDRLLKSTGFTQKKADSQVRWAVLNTILILHGHEEARLKLAEAMSLRSFVGSCIDIIENSIDHEDVQHET
jgi:hypothetical protein